METIKILGIIMLVVSTWFVFEIWRAPLYKEKSDGRYTEIEPPKKLSDLFKKRKK